MENEELGALFADYNRVIEELRSKDTFIIEGLKQLNRASQYIQAIDSPRVHRQLPELDAAAKVAEKIQAYLTLAAEKKDLEERLKSAGYRDYIQPTPASPWEVAIPA